MLIWLYGFLFAVQVLALISCCRRRRGLGILLSANAASVVLAAFLLWYFDTLPGYGIMPGFAYFPEVIYSLGAAVVFALLTLTTFLARMYYRKK